MQFPWFTYQQEYTTLDVQASVYDFCKLYYENQAAFNAMQSKWHPCLHHDHQSSKMWSCRTSGQTL